MSTHLRALALAFCLLFYGSVLASEDLLLIEVHAEKDLHVFTMGSTQKVSTLEIETQTNQLVSELMKGIPGVMANQDGGPGARTSFFIRGTESRHVSFTLDGLKLNDPSNNDRQFNSAFFTSAALASLEVYKGPQAVLFGSDAMGGLVDMRTRKGENAPETRLIVNGGSFGTLDSSLSTDWKKKTKNQGTLTLSQFRTDGISRSNQKRFHATERDATDITQLTSSSKHQWTNKFQTDILANFLEGRNELDGTFDDNTKDKSKNDQYLLQQKTHYEVSDSTAFSLRNGLNRHQRFLKTEAQGQESYNGNLLQNELLCIWEKNYVSLLSAMATEREDFQYKKLDKAFDLRSEFIQLSLKKGPWKWQSGVRAENHSQYGDFFTGSSGVGYSQKNHSLSVQYSQGYKMPSLYHLYAPPFSGFPVGNIHLAPESNHSWEGKWLVKHGLFETETAVFQNRLSNLITFSNQGYFNQDRFIAEGVELSTKLKSKKVEVAPSFTHQRFRKNESVVLRRPLNSAQLLLSFFMSEESELYFSGKWFSARKDLHKNGHYAKLNGYETLDMGYKIVQGKNDYGIQIVNVFNREYEQLYGYSVMPLSYFIHYGRRFN